MWRNRVIFGEREREGKRERKKEGDRESLELSEEQTPDRKRVRACAWSCSRAWIELNAAESCDDSIHARIFDLLSL